MVFLQSHGVSTTLRDQHLQDVRRRGDRDGAREPLPAGGRHLRHRLSHGGRIAASLGISTRRRRERAEAGVLHVLGEAPTTGTSTAARRRWSSGGRELLEAEARRDRDRAGDLEAARRLALASGVVESIDDRRPGRRRRPRSTSVAAHGRGGRGRRGSRAACRPPGAAHQRSTSRARSPGSSSSSRIDARARAAQAVTSAADGPRCW